MKILYTSFVNGTTEKVQQRIIDTEGMDLLTYVAAEAGLSLEDLIGTPDNPAPTNPDHWVQNEYGLFLTGGDCVESYHILEA